MSNRSSYFLNYAPRPYICSLGQLSRKFVPSGFSSSQYSEGIQALLYPLLPQRLLVLSSIKLCETVRLAFTLYTKITVKTLKQHNLIFICLIGGLLIRFMFFCFTIWLPDVKIFFFFSFSHGNERKPHV